MSVLIRLKTAIPLTSQMLQRQADVLRVAAALANGEKLFVKLDTAKFTNVRAPSRLTFIHSVTAVANVDGDTF
jgi:hypothetical protein